MKTLKQIREEYNSRFISQVDSLPEELMLEDSKSNKEGVPRIPTISEMPSLLVFRRISFRMYPGKQVVALYYSKLLDKYLSIPFGPGGNLNLSEGVILDEEQLDEFLGTALRSVGSKILKGAKSLVKKGIKTALGDDGEDDDKEKESGQNHQTVDHVRADHLLRDKPTGRQHSSWENAPKDNPVMQTKLRQAALKENKISDLRKMVNEGRESMDININGKQFALNTSMAKRILEVYDSVNTKNKKIVEGMLNEDLESFKKLLNFSVRN